jgi:hypothetical protein
VIRTDFAPTCKSGQWRHYKQARSTSEMGLGRVKTLRRGEPIEWFFS